MRFSLLGRFQRVYPLSLRPHAIRNDQFFSWSSLFFYRCTDRISFARLKSQDISSRAIKIGTLPAPSGPQPRVDFGEDSVETWESDYPADPIIPLPVRQQPWGAKPLKSNMGDWPTPSEPQVVKPHKNKPYFREKPVATVPPPCSPKSIYILASLVRQPSTGCIGRDTNTSDQARNPAPL